MNGERGETRLKNESGRDRKVSECNLRHNHRIDVCMLRHVCETVGELSERECEAKAPILFQLEISVCVVTLGGRVVKAWVHEELCGYEL